jgi:signal transduction histidine kinase
VEADRERMLQVLGNLLGNALKFTPPGGDIRVEVAPDAEGTVAFRVQDAGPGIPPEDVPHLFDRYWQKSGGREGAGLGLYIARGIIEAHGGTLSVDSRPGEGACFTFTLPRVD